jgi:hypothetical protein
MTRRRLAVPRVVVWTAALWLIPAAAAAQAPSAAPAAGQAAPPAIDAVLERAGLYVTTFAEQFSSVVAEERSEQSASGGPRDIVTERRLVADVLVVRVPGTQQWMGFRDVYEVNKSRVHDRQDRLLKLFVESPATAVQQARRLADESARYNVGDMTRNFNLPTTALFFLHPSAQWRFKYKKTGEQVRDGVRYWEVRGTEWARPTFVQTSIGKDTELTTEYLIDPATGRVARSTMRLKYPAETDITVDYRSDEALGMWVPARMDESYTQGMSRIRATATYANFRRFQVSTDTAFRD